MTVAERLRIIAIHVPAVFMDGALEIERLQAINADLLEACKAGIACLELATGDGFEKSGTAYFAMRAAIAKAEGRTP